MKAFSLLINKFWKSVNSHLFINTVSLIFLHNNFTSVDYMVSF